MTKSAPPLTRIADLAASGLMAAAEARMGEAVAARYAIGISPAMVEIIDRAAPDDPIARQFIPDARELITSADERADPIGDHAHSPLPGLVHRYPDRVLLKLVHICPVYCRFCFRREMVGPTGDGTLSGAALEAALAYIAADARIFEVILTGGDPLMLSARRIRALGEKLKAIAHVEVIRWHSRVPIVSPERVSDDFARALQVPGKAVYVMVHTNHARELTAAARGALNRLDQRGIGLLSQSVLLKGVNDRAETLADLFRALVALKVKPANLHHPDLAPGTGHFRLTITEGQAIYGALRGRISGHAIPAYIVDLPGGYGKVPIGPDYTRRTAAGALEIRDPAGTWHAYPET